MGQLPATRMNFRRRLALERKSGQCLGFTQFKPANHVFDLGHDGWRGTQFIHAEADQQRREHGIPAISPHTPAQIPRWCAASTVILMRRMMAGCVGS